MPPGAVRPKVSPGLRSLTGGEPTPTFVEVKRGGIPSTSAVKPEVGNEVAAEPEAPIPDTKTESMDVPAEVERAIDTVLHQCRRRSDNCRKSRRRWLSRLMITFKADTRDTWNRNVHWQNN